MAVHPPALSSAHSKLDRARTHLRALHKLCEPLLDASAYEIRPDIERHGCEYRFRVHAMPMVPDQLSEVIGDCIHNIAATLDHIAWGLVADVGGTPNSDTSYKIFRTSRKKRVWLTGLPPNRDYPFLDVIDWHQPHRRHGSISDALPIIEDLDIIDKHRELLVAAAVPALPWWQNDEGSTQPIDARYWEIPMEPPNEVMRVTFNTPPNFDLKPHFEVEVRLREGADYLSVDWAPRVSILTMLDSLITDIALLLSAIGNVL